MSKYGERPINWFEAIVNKLGGERGAEKLLRGDTMVVERVKLWQELKGPIVFTVTSDGTTSKQWVKRFIKSGVHVSPTVNEILRGSNFRPTCGVTTKVMILRNPIDSNRWTTKYVHAEAGKLGLQELNIETVCLMRIMFSEEHLSLMGLLRIIGMHKPIPGLFSSPVLLGLRAGNHRLVDAYDYDPVGGWDTNNGFAFAMSPSM